MPLKYVLNCEQHFFIFRSGLSFFSFILLSGLTVTGLARVYYNVDAAAAIDNVPSRDILKGV
jgi:hypothetical protein